jgi:hypothetical protein
MISNEASNRPHNLRVLSRTLALLGCILPGTVWAGQSGDTGLVYRALQNEISAAQDGSHPMQYTLRRSTPRLTSTKQIVETKDGAVARLLTVNDAELSPLDRQKDDARLDTLLADPSRQRKRKQNEQDDAGRALKVLRALPKAFLFAPSGEDSSGAGKIAHFAFRPNPKFSSGDLELLVLTAMAGTLTVDVAHERVIRLEGHLQQDVDIGWGILGRLNKGGWLTIDQAEIGSGIWRITRFQLDMSGRVFFKTKSFNTIEEESRFAAVPRDMTYQQAIQLLRSGRSTAATARK